MSHPTRDALLDAGTRVAERHGLAGLSVNRVVAEAGVAKGTFYVQYGHARGHSVFRNAREVVSTSRPFSITLNIPPRHIVCAPC